ncbi:MAG: methyltransferase domain-containing protein [Bacteroidales bacterium]|nr:methyltransferase domain-containing protein [Bacteroidales bacterium]
MEKLIRKIIPAQVLKQFRLLLQLPTLILHRGATYQCPICGYKSKNWYVIGRDSNVYQKWQVISGGERKAGCYKCHSTDKERLLYIYLQDFLKQNVTTHYQILHFAPERGIYEFLSKLSNVEYITADLYSEGFQYFAKKIKPIDILNIPFDNDFVDLIICNHVLEHIPDDRLAMNELYRVLKPGGHAILQVPISPILEKTIEDSSITGEEERTEAFGQSDHVRIYGQDYFERLKSVGFKVMKINSFENKEFFGLNPKESILLATK